MYSFNFNQTKLVDFLSTAQSGSAHKSSGLSFKGFLLSLVASVIIVTLEVLLFSFLRPRLDHIYLPRCLNVSGSCKIDRLENSLFSWLPTPTTTHPLNHYFELGPDKYFFLRYLNVLLKFFSLFAVINNTVLLPTNLFGNKNSKEVSGFDKLSISNISSDKAYRYYIHFFMALFVICSVQYIIMKELENWVTIQSIAVKEYKSCTMVLIDNIPDAIQDSGVLKKSLDQLPGGISDISFVKDVRIFFKLVKQFKKAQNNLEVAQCRYLSKIGTDKNIIYKSERPTLRTPFSYGKFSFSAPFLGRKLDALDYYSESLCKLNEELMSMKNEFSQQEASLLNKIFILFNKSLTAHIVSQIVLFEGKGLGEGVEVIQNPENLIWNNVSSPNGIALQLKKVFSRLLAISLTVLWVIPVSAVGIVAQLPYLCTLIPFLNMLNHLPKVFKDLVSSLLPTIALVCLTETVFFFFQILSKLKSYTTETRYQVDLQKWYFLFLFFHVFLVVTISSGITVIAENLINNPVSIPALLATDLPKASNFFHSFFVIRGLLYFGNTLLQPKALFDHFFTQKVSLKTPRQKQSCLRENTKPSWGTIFPTFSVLACIGIIYSTVSPLILIFCSFSFHLVSTGFRHNMVYVYDTSPKEQLGGNLYPPALFLLYAGIYCLELALIGLFMLQSYLFLSSLTIIVFLLTIVTNTKLKKKCINQSSAVISLREMETTMPSTLSTKSMKADLWVVELIEYFFQLLIPPIPEEGSKDNVQNETRSDRNLSELTVPRVPTLEVMLPAKVVETHKYEINRFKSRGISVLTDTTGFNDSTT